MIFLTIYHLKENVFQIRILINVNAKTFQNNQWFVVFIITNVSIREWKWIKIAFENKDKIMQFIKSLCVFIHYVVTKKNHLIKLWIKL